MKVLMIQERISNYNVPAFNFINQYVDLTLLYFDGVVPGNVEFKTVKCYRVHLKKGGWKFSKEDIQMIKSYDVLICAPNFQNLPLLSLTFSFGRKRTIYYGIGVNASYDHSYDGNSLVSTLFSFYLRTIGAAVFYTDYPKKKYSKMGINDKKLFVANNTTEVLNINPNDTENKKNFLFVGSLYKEKGISELLEEYEIAFKQNQLIANLLIVGDGEERKEIEKYIFDHNLTAKVKLLGAIYDESVLAPLFKQSIACISPNQAGLSVLKSMGYATVFVTKREAITGGEIFNIKEDNGVLYNEKGELSDIILDIFNHPNKYIQMGKNAYDYYYKYCTVENMAKGFLDAIEYVIKIV